MIELTVFIITFFLATFSYAQSTTMLAMLLEDGKEESYLKLEENWQKVNEALVAEGYITQWSVWKRTPREGVGRVRGELGRDPRKRGREVVRKNQSVNQKHRKIAP